MSPAMFWKVLIAAAVLAILVGGGVWISDGMQFFTKDREPIVTVTKDPLFGTETESTTWVETFRLGLLPDDAAITAIHRSYGFILGVSGAVIIGSWIMLKRTRGRS